MLESKEEIGQYFEQFIHEDAWMNIDKTKMKTLLFEMKINSVKYIMNRQYAKALKKYFASVPFIGELPKNSVSIRKLPKGTQRKGAGHTDGLEVVVSVQKKKADILQHNLTDFRQKQIALFNINSYLGLLYNEKSHVNKKVHNISMTTQFDGGGNLARSSMSRSESAASNLTMPPNKIWGISQSRETSQITASFGTPPTRQRPMNFTTIEEPAGSISTLLGPPKEMKSWKTVQLEPESSEASASDMIFVRDIGSIFTLGYDLKYENSISIHRPSVSWFQEQKNRFYDHQHCLDNLITTYRCSSVILILPSLIIGL
eukprot:UN25071